MKNTKFNEQRYGGNYTNKAVKIQLNDERSDAPTTTHTEIIGGKKYVVVSHYIGKKDFKEVFGDFAFRQVLAEMKNSVD